MDIRELETERLILRPIKMEDLEDIYEYASDEETARYTTWSPHKNREETKAFIESELSRYEEGTCHDFAVVLKENNKMIGTSGVFNARKGDKSVEIGYVMNRKYWGQGIMPEAVREIIRFLFDEWDVHRITAKHYIGNPKSGRVMQKVGMTHEGTMIDEVYVKERYFTTHHYSIINPKHGIMDEIQKGDSKNGN